MYIAIDFDGTIVDHKFPDMGKPVPGAIEWMKIWHDAGGKLILWTMRSDGQDNGDVLQQAVDYCDEHDVEFFDVNGNSTQSPWTDSPKAYAKVYIDNAAFGCPLKENPEMGGRPYVDWDVVGPAVLEMIENYLTKKTKAVDKPSPIGYNNTISNEKPSVGSQ